LLGFINVQAGCACEENVPLNKKPPCREFPAQVEPSQIFPALSNLVKSTLVVNTNEEGRIACPAAQELCSRAWVRLEVNTFMDDGSDGWGSPKTDLVKFKYEAKGYVVWTDLAATPIPTATPTTTPTATPTPTPTAAP
jgi:hypothetical protein